MFIPFVTNIQGKYKLVLQSVTEYFLTTTKIIISFFYLSRPSHFLLLQREQQEKAGRNLSGAINSAASEFFALIMVGAGDV
jgi:hypothetical protein